MSSLSFSITFSQSATPNRCISMETLTFPELDFLDFIDTTIQGKIVYGSSRKTAYSHTKD